jgi:hypothetical protein
MALYWHPFLAQMLRLSYADRLLVQEQISLGDMPLQADLLVIRRDPNVSLPYPLEFLGPRTLVEFKSPDDTADQAALEQLDIYGLLYVRREGLPRRRDLTLWLMATNIAANVSQPGRTELTGVQDVGPGVRRGTLDGFPTFLLDLQAVPFSPNTIPLHMVAGGRQERALVEYLIEHYKQYPHQLDLLASLHGFALMEALIMHNLTPEQIGIDYDALSKIIPPEQFLKHHSLEAILDEWAKQHGVEKVRKWLERKGESPPDPSQSGPLKN